MFKYKNIIDTHTHSINSFDGNHSVYDMCQGVIEKGGIGIAITDHVDIDGDDYDTKKQYEDIVNIKGSFYDLTVMTGIELGQGVFRKEKSERLLSTYNYDFVLGSIHNLDGMEDFYFLDYKKFDIDNLLTQYFSALYELAKWDMTDSIAHLTYPLRYIIAREHINIDISKYYDIIDEIFREIIKNNKALELNTSGLFMDMKDTLPNKSFIKRFHDLGGKYVTVGSDSHYKEKVCQGLDVGLDILLECGFDSFTIFKERTPVLVPIE